MTEARAEFFIEILCEEIPASMQQNGVVNFANLLESGLNELGVSSSLHRVFCAPRRIAVSLTDVPTIVPDRVIEKRGPRVDAGDGPIRGFLSSLGISKEALEIRTTPKGDFYFASHTVRGGLLIDLLPAIISDAIKSIQWPSSMTWSVGKNPWVRPIKSLLCFFDGKPLEFSMDFGIAESLVYTNDYGYEASEIKSASFTYGHRFMSDDKSDCGGAIAVSSPDAYERILESKFVMPCHKKRKEKIWQDALLLASAKGLSIVEDASLLDEVVGLVEWPIVMIGAIKHEFMVLPEEVLMTSMRVHQRYFALRDQDGKLAPYFIFVANVVGSDGGKTIVSGNEKVLKARLSDALFFYEKDKKFGLSNYRDGLNKITFHKDLGSLYDKVERLKKLTPFIGALMGLGDDVQAACVDVASLCKLDLMTDMVGEFPELQGVMGYYYSREAGFSHDVCRAILEHYMPKGATSDCPQTPVGIAIAIADRIDTLIGFFGIGVMPTGSKDPFALRRATLGILRILESGYNLKLRDVLEKAYELYGGGVLKFSSSETIDSLHDFFTERLKVYWKDVGYNIGVVKAVSHSVFDISISSLKSSVVSLDELIKSEDGAKIIALYKRVSNLLKNTHRPLLLDLSALDTSLFAHDSEFAIYNQLTDVLSSNVDHGHKDSFNKSLQTLLTFSGPMDAFFDAVMVLDENSQLRRNRLSLMLGVQKMFDKVADFSSL